MQDDSLVPVPTERRTLSALDIAAIWFGAAIVISECWAGGQPSLAGLGLGAGLVAIVVGGLIGNGLMGAMAGRGAASGLPTMVLTRPAFGVRGSLLPAAANVIQLVGWTAWMYFVGYLYLEQLAVAMGLPSTESVPAMEWVWIGALAILCTVCSFVGAEVWHRVLKIAALAMLGLTVWMTILIFRRYSPAEIFRMPAAGGTTFLAGADLVIAMSVSWLPLVADYSRFAKTGRGSALATFGGYFLGGTWMYGVGLVVAIAVGTAAPDGIVVTTMAEAGLVPVLLGIVLVLVSTVTTTFLDIYSAVVSAQNVAPKLPARAASIVIGIGSAALAVLLDVFQFEPFLLWIGAIFLPIFTIVFLHHFVLDGRRIRPEEIDRRGGAYWFTGGVNVPAVLAVAAGVAAFKWMEGSSFGASLPTMLATVAAYLLLRLPFPRPAR